MAADSTVFFATAPVPDAVRSFRTQRADAVRSFQTAATADGVRSFRTRVGDAVASFETAERAPAPAGVSFVVDQTTGLVTLTYQPTGNALAGPLTALVTRLRDSLPVLADASLSGSTVTATFGTEQDGVYHVRVLDATGGLLLDVYLPVAPRGWRCWRAENHRVATAGRHGEGEAPGGTWQQLLARLLGAEDLVRVLDPEAADAVLASLATWCRPTGEPLSCSCPC